MVRYLSFLLILFMLTACSNSPLNDAKSLMKQGDYPEALKKLDEAKINEPNNKDIDKLIEMAKEKENAQGISEGLQDYIYKTEPLITELLSLSESYDVDNLNVDSIQEIKDKYEPIKKELQSIRLKGDFGLSGDPNITLDTALSRFDDALSEGINLAKKNNGGNMMHNPVAVSLDIFKDDIDEYHQLIADLKSEN